VHVARHGKIGFDTAKQDRGPAQAKAQFISPLSSAFVFARRGRLRGVRPKSIIFSCTTPCTTLIKQCTG
jgi:hypothetical protein